MMATRIDIKRALEDTKFGIELRDEEDSPIHYRRYGGVHIADVDRDGVVNILYVSEERPKITIGNIMRGLKLREILERVGASYVETPSRDEIIAGLEDIANGYKKKIDEVDVLADRFS